MPFSSTIIQANEYSINDEATPRTLYLTTITSKVPAGSGTFNLKVTYNANYDSNTGYLNSVSKNTHSSDLDGLMYSSVSIVSTKRIDNYTIQCKLSVGVWLFDSLIESHYIYVNVGGPR